MKYLGITLMIAGIAAFIAPRLNLQLPEGVTIPTLPSDILGGILLISGIALRIYEERQ
jgi:hypothetical protein